MPAKDDFARVRRVSGSDKSQSVGEEATAAATEVLRPQIDRQMQRQTLLQAAFAPLIELPTVSNSALDASAKLAALARDEPPALPVFHDPATLPSITFGNVHPGLSFFVPPFDHGHRGPIENIDEKTIAVDDLLGTCSLEIPIRGDFSGHRLASAGLGLDLVPTADCHVAIRPAAQIEWNYFTDGWLLDSHIHATVATQVFELGGGPVSSPTQYTVFNANNDDAESFGEKTLGGDTLAVTFPAHGGRRYQLWITAAIWSVQSGTHIGFSVADGRLAMRVLLVVADAS